LVWFIGSTGTKPNHGNTSPKLMFEIEMTYQLLSSLVMTVFGCQIATHIGKYAEIIVKKNWHHKNIVGIL